MKKIYFFEPYFFILFGIFHLHRVWGLINREAYAAFWLDMLEGKGICYYLIMGVLAFLCVIGIVTFFKNINRNYWWRWIYIFGGAYLLFDLFAILTELSFWHELLIKMFDTTAAYWNYLWGGFVIMGGLVFVLGIFLQIKRKQLYGLENK